MAKKRVMRFVLKVVEESFIFNIYKNGAHNKKKYQYRSDSNNDIDFSFFWRRFNFLYQRLLWFSINYHDYLSANNKWLLFNLATKYNRNESIAWRIFIVTRQS